MYDSDLEALRTRYRAARQDGQFDDHDWRPDYVNDVGTLLAELDQPKRMATAPTGRPSGQVPVRRDELMREALTAACRVIRPELDEDDVGPGSLGHITRKPIEAAVSAVLDAVEADAARARAERDELAAAVAAFLVRSESAHGDLRAALDTATG